MREAIIGAATGALRRAGRVGQVVGPGVDLDLSTGFGGALGSARSRRLAGRLDRTDLAVYRRIWLDAADELGASVEDRPGGYLAIHRHGSSTLVWRNLVQFDDPVVLRRASDKPVVHSLVRGADLPVPAHALFDRGDLRPALRFLESVGPPVVVKPAVHTGRGDGVTCGVSTATDLARASLRASRFGPLLLIEQQGKGQELRLLFLDGALIGGLARRPPHVVGDGRSSVADLVAAENERRMRSEGQAGLFPIVVDLDCVLALRSQELTLQHHPRVGEQVRVKSMANAGGPEDNTTLPARTLSPNLVDACRRAVTVIGLRLGAARSSCRIRAPPRPPLG